jgi:hypothetical protein
MKMKMSSRRTNVASEVRCVIPVDLSMEKGAGPKRRDYEVALES